MALNTQLTDTQIEKKIDNCPKLASLRSINNALSELVHAEQSFTSQIAEIIRRDPTLTTRLLKLANSVFFGLSKRVTNIEDAIFYIGLRQIRELALATPVMEDFNTLNKNKKIDWRLLWQHSIGTAIVTRELVSAARFPCNDDTDYIAGLVHNVGSIVFASVFPEQFDELRKIPFETIEEQCQEEVNLVGWNHAHVGAYYLRKHQLSDDVVDAVRHHHDPGKSDVDPRLSAAIQVADCMVRSTGIFGIEDVCPVEEDSWEELSGWEILFGSNVDEETEFALTALKRMLDRLPSVLQEIV